MQGFISILLVILVIAVIAIIAIFLHFLGVWIRALMSGASPTRWPRAML